MSVTWPTVATYGYGELPLCLNSIASIATAATDPTMSAITTLLIYEYSASLGVILQDIPVTQTGRISH